MDTEVKIIGVVGSLRRPSYTKLSVKIVLDAAKELGALVDLVDLRDYDLPYCMQYSSDEMSSSHKASIDRLSQQFQNADGIVLGSPEYHGGMSGVLKNAIDLLGFKEFEGKVVGLLGVAGGDLGATNTLNQMRTIGRNLHAWVIPNQVSIPRAGDKFDEHGNCTDEKLVQRLTKLGEDVVRFSFLHKSEKINDFVSMWLKGPQNPGGD